MKSDVLWACFPLVMCLLHRLHFIICSTNTAKNRINNFGAANKPLPLPAKIQTELDQLHKTMVDGKLYHCQHSVPSKAKRVPRNKRNTDGQTCDLALNRLNHLRSIIETLVREKAYAYTQEPLDPNNTAWVLRRDIGGGQRRTDYMQAKLTRANVRERAGSFSSSQRRNLFTILGGDFDADEAGHILANTLGGPNTAQNFFPQHRAVNANRGVRPLVDNWYETENKIRKFLTGEFTPTSSQIPLQNRVVTYSVMLEYEDSHSVGRPTRVTFLAVFGGGTNAVMDMMGGTFRNGENNGPLTVRRVKKQ